MAADSEGLGAGTTVTPGLVKTHRGLRWTALGLAMVALGDVAIAFSLGIIWPREGPLASQIPGVGGAGGLVSLDRPFTYGVLTDIENQGDEDATLDDVALVGASRGLRLIGTYVVPAGTGPSAGLIMRWPPPAGVAEGYRDLVGALVPPGEAVDLLLVFEVGDAGQYEFRSIEIPYHVGAVRYRASYATGMYVCAPIADWTLNECRPEWVHG